jgi:hypothetical protein
VGNGLEEGDALPSLPLNFALEYAIGMVQKNRVGLKLNETCQMLACDDDVNLLGDSIDTRKRNTEAIIDTSKEVGLEVNTVYIAVSSPECREK